jgi:hypothetical protein
MCSPISSVLLVLCCLLLGSYVAVFCVVTCRRMQRRDHFVATQPLESNAPLRHAINRTISRRIATPIGTFQLTEEDSRRKTGLHVLHNNYL